MSFQKWQQQFKSHKKTWTNLRALLGERKPNKRILISQEWPKDCDLFREQIYLSAKEKIGLEFESTVKRCCLDGIVKVWRIMCNNEELAGNMSTPICKCQEAEVGRITDSGFYSVPVARHVLLAHLKVR